MDHAWVTAWAKGERLVMTFTPSKRRETENAGYAVEPIGDDRFVVTWADRVPWTIRETIRG